MDSLETYLTGSDGVITETRETIIYWLDRQIVSKQPDMSTYHYVQNQEKLRMQSRENDPNSQFGKFLDDFEVKYLQIANFSEK